MISETPLAELTASNTAFSNTLPGLQIAWDTVSSGTLKTCPRKYQLAHVEGWEPKHQSPHLRFGLLAHEAIEKFFTAEAKGENFADCMDAMLVHLLEASGERKLAHACSCGTVTTVEASQGICPGCMEMLPTTTEVFFPWDSDHKYKNRKNLIRTMVWFFENYKDSPLKTVILKDGSPAVELWFKVELDLKTPDGVPYIMTGHIDRLVELHETFWFCDLKTTAYTISSSFFEKFQPDNQMSLYTVGGKIIFEQDLMGGIIDGAQVAIGFSAFSRGMIEMTKGSQEEWLSEFKMWIKQAEMFAKAEYWPANDTACHHYGGCDFLDVCKRDPKSRLNKLKTNFKQREWNPLKERK